MQPLVSIVVPSYNYARFVGHTLRSFQAQTLQDWECWVVDDGSKDDTAEVVRAFTESDPRIRYIYQENQGVSIALNTGMQAARGKYLQVIGADDLLQADKLRLLSEYLEAHPETDLAYGDLRYFYDHQPERLICSPQHPGTPWTLNRSGRGKALLPFLVVSCSLMPIMPLFRREVLLGRVGGFLPGLHAGEDWDLFLRCALADLRFDYVTAPDTLSLLRLHGGNTTFKRPLMIVGLMRVRERLRQALQERPDLLRLNERLLDNDMVEQAIITQKHQGHFKGAGQAFGHARSRGSVLIFFWALLLCVFPNALSLKLLGLQRSLQKRLAYRRFGKGL